MKVIFDRSAFHGSRFDVLAGSPLLALSKQRRISVYHTPILIEETIRMYLKEKNREELRRQLPYIFEICQDRWLRDRAEIWVKELVEEADPRESVFLPDNERRDSEENIRRMVFDNAFDQTMFDEAKKAMDENGVKAGNIRQSTIKMRDDISKELKLVKKSRKDIQQTAGQYVDATLDETGTEMIKKHLPVGNAIEIAEKWKKQKQRYPHFTLFTRGFLYSGYYAMAHPNEPIDFNMQVDVSQLCYLHGVDAIVSNDEKFMKKAFDFMYPSGSKQFFTAESFAKHLEEINAK